MASLAEQELLMRELMRLAQGDFDALWKLALDSGDPFAFILDAFPELAAQYATIAADMAAVWYDEAAPHLPYVATPVLIAETTRYRENAAWALGSGDGLDDPKTARDKLLGSLQRAVYDADRETMVANAEAEGGARWVRRAGPTACSFCKMLATRAHLTGTFYSSKVAAEQVVGRGKEMSLTERRARARGETRISGRFIAGGRRTRGSREIGRAYHDDCDCRAVPVRPGQTYEAPDYVQQWAEDYKKASRMASGDSAGAGDVKAIMAAWRQIDAGN